MKYRKNITFGVFYQIFACISVNIGTMANSWTRLISDQKTVMTKFLKFLPMSSDKNF